MSKFCPKKKLCSQNENFSEFFVTLIFFSVTNVKNLQDLSRKKKNGQIFVHFLKKAKTLLKIVNYLISLLFPNIGEHVGKYLYWFMNNLILYHNINIFSKATELLFLNVFSN